MSEVKKELTRRDFLKKSAIGTLGLMATGVLGGTVIARAEQPAGTYIPGTYSAEAKGAQGTVTVTMTFDAENITDVKVDVSQETPTIGGLHGEELEQAILNAQSAHIDTITSATMTSTAARTAAAACIAQAKGETVEVLSNEPAGPSARPFGYMSAVAMPARRLPSQLPREGQKLRFLRSTKMVRSSIAAMISAPTIQSFWKAGALVHMTLRPLSTNMSAGQMVAATPTSSALSFTIPVR